MRALIDMANDTFSRLKQVKDLLAVNDPVAAQRLCEQICSSDKMNLEAHFLLGGICASRGQFEQAETRFTQAVVLNPNIAESYYNLGLCQLNQGKPQQAEPNFRTALRLNPRYTAACYNLAAILESRGNLEEATALFQNVTQLAPADASPHLRLGVIHQNLNQLEPAGIHYERAIALGTRDSDLFLNLGVVRLQQQRYPAALEHLTQALHLNPQHAKAHYNLGTAYLQMGRIVEAIRCFEQAVAIAPAPAFAEAHSSLLCALNYSADLDPASISVAHLEWGKRYGVPPQREMLASSQRRLRIGYVSPDLREHAVATFLLPLLEHHDKNAFEIFCYANVAVPDAMTQRIQQQADVMRNIYAVSDELAAAMICDDGIDILVDLAGHTAGNRLGLFALKPAPVQLTYLGYPNTTGLEAMDYRFTDAHADPVDTGRSLHSETLVRLPHGFLCYRPPEDAPLVGELPALQAGHATFGSFNNLAKVTPQVIALWAQLLGRVPSAHLLLKAKPLADAAVQAQVLAGFAEHGIAAERIALLGAVPAAAQHMAMYGQVDIALDPFPYNGTTTTCEALWMGVPVITLAGDRHAARVGASLLAQVGQNEWVAKSADEYLEIAAMLAGDLAGLAKLRGVLRERLRKSPLCDEKRFARDVEDAYRQMLEKKANG
jgi:predicted O-linked N-acetylglucosamine transferase (SPINDLY family)